VKEFPPFRLDLVNQCLWRDGAGAVEQRILLTPKAFAMLRHLVEHAGRLVTQEEFLQALWPETYVQPEVLKSHIRDIRSALGDDPKIPRFIETLPRRGYRFIAPVTDDARKANQEVGSRANRLVGRKPGLDQLRESFQRALHGERQLVFVTGEPGIGKTSLIDAFQSEVAADNRLRIARGQCVEGYGGQEPYYPMLEALGPLCRGGGPDSVEQVLASQAPTWLVQFPALMKREQREKLQRELLGAGRERMLREMADALETITAESPLLVVFEDMQWADSSTIDLLSVVARRRRPAKLMLLATYRPVDVLLAEHPLKRLKQDLLIRGLCHEIALEPLGQADIAEFLAAESPEHGFPSGLAALLFRHSEGNPLFMVAALQHMRERKLITEEGGRWQMSDPLEAIDVQAPDSLRQMIETQIDRVNEGELRALEAASIVGVTFSTAIAAAAANMDAEEFEKVFERLLRRNQIVRLGDSPRFVDGNFSENYQFIHALYREVLYRRQSPRRRTRVHLLVGERLEAFHAQRLSEAAAELAHHFEQGGDWLRAIRYLMLAANNACRRFEPNKGARILEHALELAGRIQEANRAVSEIEILERLGVIYVVCFDTRAIQVYEAVVDRASRCGLVDVQVRALFAMALPLAWVSAGGYREALDRALQLSANQDPVARTRTRTTCLLWRLGAEWNSQDAEECLTAYAAIRQTGDSLAVRSLAEWSYFHFNSSHYREAHRCATESLAMLTREAEDSLYLSATYAMYQNIIWRIHLFLGEWGDALREAEAQVATAAKNGNPDLARLLHINSAYIHLHGMDFDGAWQISESIRGLPAWEGLRRFGGIVAGCADVGRSALQSALEQLLAVRHDMERQPLMEDWQLNMPLQWGLTEAWLAKGDFAQARLEGELFLKVTLAAEERAWQALAFEANVRVAIGEGDLLTAQGFMIQALQAMEGFEVPLAAWRVHGTASALHERMREPGPAEKHRELSRAIIMKLADSMPVEEPLRKKFLLAPAVRNLLEEKPLLVGSD
jgi:DNA-binding winged helix-turn-helix (wHTH) protein